MQPLEKASGKSSLSMASGTWRKGSTNTDKPGGNGTQLPYSCQNSLSPRAKGLQHKANYIPILLPATSAHRNQLPRHPKVQPTIPNLRSFGLENTPIRVSWPKPQGNCPDSMFSASRESTSQSRKTNLDCQTRPFGVSYLAESSSGLLIALELFEFASLASLRHVLENRARPVGFCVKISVP